MGASVARPDRMDEGWTVPGILKRSVQEHGHRPCLTIVNGIEETYAQTWDSVARLARRLASHGVTRQDNVILMLGNTHLSVHAWLAVNLLNAVDVNINTGFKGESLVHAVNLCQARTLGQVTRRPCLQEAGRKRVFLTYGHHYNLDVRVTAQQLGGGAKTANPRHLHVHQHHIRLQFPSLDQGLLPRFSLADYLQAIDVSQHSCNACTNEIMVIDY